MAWGAFANFWPTLMLDRYGVSLEWSGNIFAINALAAAIAGMGIGVLVSRWDVRRAVIVMGGLALGATLVSMNLTGAIPVLIAADIVNGVAWGFWPVMMTIPFQLRGIRPRETAVALAFVDTCLVLAGATGPALAGVIGEATDDLRLALIVTSVFCLALCITGLTLPFGRLRNESAQESASP
jgi:predicted MFS family arabinose efflux permease